MVYRRVHISEQAAFLFLKLEFRMHCDICKRHELAVLLIEVNLLPLDDDLYVLLYGSVNISVV